MTLTPKEERFAQLVAGGATYSDAYRGAYDAENMSDPAINTEASRLAKNPKISPRIKALQEALQEAATIDTLWSLELSIKTKLKITLGLIIVKFKYGGYNGNPNN